MDYLEIFSRIFGGVGGLGLIVALVILYKTGVLEFLKNWKKNGNSAGSPSETSVFLTEFSELKNNHLEHINSSLLELIRQNNEIIKQNQEILFIVREIHERE